MLAKIYKVVSTSSIFFVLPWDRICYPTPHPTYDRDAFQKDLLRWNSFPPPLPFFLHAYQYAVELLDFQKWSSVVFGPIYASSREFYSGGGVLGV